MSSSSGGQPLVPAATTPLPTAEEEDAEEDAEESDDSDLEHIRLEWERTEYIRCHRLPTDYFDGWTNEELQGFDDALPTLRNFGNDDDNSPKRSENC